MWDSVRNMGSLSETFVCTTDRDKGTRRWSFNVHDEVNVRDITKGLLDALLKSCATLDLIFTPAASIEFLGKKFSFLEATPRLLRRILRIASVQSLYKVAITSSRKDLQTWGIVG